MKKAFITGVTGQDGSYLAEFLISKGYDVYGLIRRNSCNLHPRIKHLIQNSDLFKKKFFLCEGDLCDTSNLISLISKIEPDEIYNLAAQSHVAVSFTSPEYTADVDALGTLRLLEAIRILGLQKQTKFYQASTSELYGKVQTVPQTETTPFYPRSPYGVAKLYAYWICVNYRESYDIFACNGILFNHESERRGDNFVTRKITKGLSDVFYGNKHCFYLGNLDAKRDWGHAKDYVEMQWLMLQQDTPDDYVISTGRQFSIREFIQKACDVLEIEILFQGKGVNEEVVVKKINTNKDNKIKEGQSIIKVSKDYFRPCEVETLLGDPSKAKEKLGWQPKITFDELVEEMMRSDIKQY